MPSRQQKLSEILLPVFGMGGIPKPSRENFEESGYHDEIMRIYEKVLGGEQDNYPTGFKGFDIQLSEAIVELDEEQHFNRYRKRTLESTFYPQNHSNEQFKKFCEMNEGVCLDRAAFGKYWRTHPSDLQFGESSPDGVFLGGHEVRLGSSRWKQRAFYDFLRDVGQKISGYNLIRVSIYDEVNKLTVGQLLELDVNMCSQPLIEYVRNQINERSK